MQYTVLYAKIIHAAKRAVAAIDECDYDGARKILIAVQRECEEACLQAEKNDNAIKNQ